MHKQVNFEPSDRPAALKQINEFLNSPQVSEHPKTLHLNNITKALKSCLAAKAEEECSNEVETYAFYSQSIEKNLEDRMAEFDACLEKAKTDGMPVMASHICLRDFKLNFLEKL